MILRGTLDPGNTSAKGSGTKGTAPEVWEGGEGEGGKGKRARAARARPREGEGGEGGEGEGEGARGEGGEGEEGEGDGRARAARAMTAATKLSNHAPDGAPPRGTQKGTRHRRVTTVSSVSVRQRLCHLAIGFAFADDRLKSR